MPQWCLLLWYGLYLLFDGGITLCDAAFPVYIVGSLLLIVFFCF